MGGTKGISHCLLLLALLTTAKGYLRVCYYTNWAQYRPVGGIFYPEDVDTSLCTHLIYAFSNLDANMLNPYEPNDHQMFKRFNGLKKINPNLKTLLAVGGASLPLSKMTAMLSTLNNRKTFIDNVINYLRKWDFDGLDLDFEYPGSYGSPPQDKQHFTLLVQEMKAAFESEAVRTGRSCLLLTAAVPAGRERIDNGYEVDKIARDLDFINLMSYDLNGAWDPHTGHNSALYPRASESPYQKQLNVDWVAKYWVQKGCPPEKLIIGLATYGRGFTLCQGAPPTMGACASGPSAAGKFTRTGGFMANYEICEILKQGATRVFDNEQKVPYIYYDHNRQWMGYEDTASIAIKVDWMKAYGFGGAMFWTMDFDDFTGNFCGMGKYPILTLVAELLEDEPAIVPTEAPELPPSSIPSKTTTQETTTASPTTPPGDQENPCQTHPAGTYPHKKCDYYHACIGGGAGFEMPCSSHTLFDGIRKTCDHAANVPKENRICSILPNWAA